MSDGIKAVREAANRDLSTHIQNAFEAGRRIGWEEARRDIREKVSRAIEWGAEIGAANMAAVTGGLQSDAFEVDEEATPTTVEDVAVSRAAPGSVKPAIERAVLDNPKGLTTEEVRRLTNAKANTVRGTLWTLSTTEKTIERRDGKWFPATRIRVRSHVPQTNKAADEQSSTAPISQPVTPSQPGFHQADPSEPGREVVDDNIEWN